MPEFSEKEKFDASTAADMVKIELEVNLDQLEDKEASSKLTGGDKQVMTVLQQAISSLNIIKSLKELISVISSSIGALKNINSDYAPKLMTKLHRAKKYIEHLFQNKDVVYSILNIRKAIKKIFAQENFEESHPELDKYQSFPASSPGDGTVMTSDTEDNRDMSLEDAPEVPENTNMLSDRVEKALQLLNEAKDLFRPDDFFIKRPRRKDRILSRLVKEILRAKRSAEVMIKLLSQRP